MLAGVGEVDDQADEQPDDHDNPGDEGEVGHEVDGREDAQQGNQRDERRLEGPVHVGVANTENPDACGNDGEGEEGADIDQFSQLVDGQEGRHDGGESTEGDGGNPGGAEFGMDGGGPLGQEAILGHGVEDAGLAEEHDEHDGGEAEDSADFDKDGAPGDAGGIDGEGYGSGDVQRLVVDQAGEHERDRDIEDGADDERAKDADGHVALRVLGLLSGSGDGVKANVSEEDGRCSTRDAEEAEVSVAIGWRDEGVPVGGSDLWVMEEEEPADGEKDADDAELDDDDGGVEICRLLDADNEHRGNEEHDDDGEEVEEAGDVFQADIADTGGQGRFAQPDALVFDEDIAGGGGERGREDDAELLEEAVEVAGPTGCDGGGTEGVFENKVPADDPGDEFAEGGIAVGVGGAGDGDDGGELRIAEAGEGAGEASEDKAKGDGGTRVESSGLAGEGEDSGTDDSADSESDEVQGTQGTLERILALFSCFLREERERLNCKQSGHR